MARGDRFIGVGLVTGAMGSNSSQNSFGNSIGSWCAVARLMGSSVSWGTADCVPVAVADGLRLYSTFGTIRATTANEVGNSLLIEEREIA